MKTCFLTILGCVMAATSCAREVPPTADELMAQLVARNMELIAHGEAGDTAAALAMHAPDAVLIPPSARVLVGEAVERALGNPAGATIRNATIAAVQAGGSRELAYLVGTFGYEVVRDEDVSTITGPFVIVWTPDEDGAWQVQVDMWNLDRPSS